MLQGVAVCCSVLQRVGCIAAIHSEVRVIFDYGVATISRLLKFVGLFLQNIVSLIGLFCKRDLYF